MVHSAALSATVKNASAVARVNKAATPQAVVEKLANGTGTDSHGNDAELNKRNSNQIIGVGIPPRKPQQLQDKGTS